MDFKQFESVVALLDSECAAVLLARAEDYAGEDRLENFKLISLLTGVPTPQVCMVLHAKHFIALAKVLQEGRYYDLDKYIVDIINYQRLLKAILLEGEVQEVDASGYVSPPLKPGYIHTRRQPE